MVKDRVKRAVRASVNSPVRAASTLLLGSLILLGTALASDIAWNMQLFERGIRYWDNAVLNSFSTLMIEGVGSFSLTLIYSALGGATLTNFLIQLRSKNFAGKELGGILPGMVATGCAGCGVGISALVGISGAAIAPFGGTLFRFSGIILLLYALYSLGDPETCRL